MVSAFRPVIFYEFHDWLCITAFIMSSREFHLWYRDSPLISPTYDPNDDVNYNHRVNDVLISGEIWT